MDVGLISPGEMGAAIGSALVSAGHTVWWASEGRSAATRSRAAQAGLHDAATVGRLTDQVPVILSVCPPHAASEVVDAAGPQYDGLLVDLNAVAPATVKGLASRVRRLVDGGIVGPPPARAGTTRVYLAGPDAAAIAGLFVGSVVQAEVVGDEIGAASALKMVYAAWTKGTTALLLAVRAAAVAHGVEDALLHEWERSLPALAAESRRAADSGRRKGWRFVGEMEEIAATFGAAGLPTGFHRAAADLFSRVPRRVGTGDGDGEELAAVLHMILSTNRTTPPP